MKKISTFIAAGLFTMLSATAFACPQGTTLSGGTVQIIKVVSALQP